MHHRMTDERKRPRSSGPDPASESAPVTEPATGVAQGSLGTGTALDDTQVFRIADFVEDEATMDSESAWDERPTWDDRPMPAGPASVDPITVEPIAGPASRPVVGSGPSALGTTVGGSGTERRIPDARTAGLGVVVVVALIAGAAILASAGNATTGNGALDPGGGLPTFALSPTAAPAGTPPAHGHGNGNGHGHGR